MQTTKNCPKCFKNLVEKEYFGVMLDECKACRGLWFDSNELNQLKEKMDESLRWIDIDLWKFANRANFKPSLYDCPKCETLISELKFQDSNVTVEFCINCGGAWLDKGELERVVNTLSIDEVKTLVAAWRMVSLKLAITHPYLFQKLRTIRQSLPL